MKLNKIVKKSNKYKIMKMSQMKRITQSLIVKKLMGFQ